MAEEPISRCLLSRALACVYARPGGSPVASNSVGGHAQGFRGFFQAQTTKRTKLDDPCFARIQPRQLFKRVVYRHDAC